MNYIKIAVLLSLLMSCPKYHWGQEKFDRFTINLGLTVPFYNSSSSLDLTPAVPEVEFLYNIPLYNIIQLSTGIGIESGKHIVVEEVAKLAWREDVKEWWPYRATNYWNLDFCSMKVPVYLTLPLNNSFIDSFMLGYGFGWLLSYELTEERTPATYWVKINRSFFDFSLGIKKTLFHFNKVSLSCNPGIGYRDYITDHNDWQQKCFLGELKFNVNF